MSYSIGGVVLLFFLVFNASISLGEGVADKSPKFSDEAIEFFERDVRPLLVRRCYSCHGPDAKEVKGGLRLDSRAAVLAGGDTGPAIVPRDAKKSLLIDAINYGDLYQMPPKSKLPAKEIATLTKWVEMGAPWPKENPSVATSKKEFNLAERKAAHWCWQPVTKPAIPAVRKKEWPQRPLDHFILAKLEEAGLQPAPAADHRTLIRRAYFDLIGLPPTPQEVDTFVRKAKRDPEGAFEEVVDRLLESKHFGERWARHWMDLVRYAESYGHEFDYPVPHAFRYRDYLIRAFNADVPYDQFVTEHIAGDLLKNPRLHPVEKYNESIIGTGFWWLGEATHAPVDVLEDEAGRVDNQIDVMCKTFLGLTVACARCHDHKFDAISTRDYYALSGFLMSSRRQEAILDPHQKIKDATDRLLKLKDEGDKVFAAAVPKPSSGFEKEIAKYLLAAREAMFGTPTQDELALAKEDIVFEEFDAETYEGWKVTGDAFGTGPVAPEKVKAYLGDVGSVGSRFVATHHRINGQDSRQTDQKTGTMTSETFTIERRFISFLIGGGAHKGRTCLNLVVDGKTVRSATGRNQGKLFPHRFDVTQFLGKDAQIQIVDNEKGGWGNVEVDHIVFSDQSDGEKGRPIESVAKQFNVDVNRLTRWVAALRDESVSNATHPLQPWRELARQDQIQRGQIDGLRKRLSERQKAADTRDQQAPLIADFNSGDFGGWFVTGSAFGNGPTQPNTWDSASRGMAPAQPGVAHSGMLAARHQGVLRSPTFTITHPNIFYRMAGKNAQIRVILDSYFMDTYNGLLFRGFSFKVNTDGKFVWHRQGGDISRYVGHRAHIEIIDHGDGWVAVDEIRFAKNGVPADEANPLALSVLSDEKVNSGESLAQSYGQLMRETLSHWHRGDCSTAQIELVNWALKHKLVDIDTDELSSVSSQIDKIANTLPAPFRVLAMAEGTGMNRRVHIRGNHRTLGEEASRQLLEATSGNQQQRIESGSGRLELARRIVDPTNPLTARVAVNRLWHHLFGRGIVASTDNFGVLGQRPTHPELLDYLAAQFTSGDFTNPQSEVRNPQSIKFMLREFMLSSTYQMSSVPNDKGSEVDPENLLLHRMRIRRLQGEAIRDAILAISGRLDRKMEGPSVAVHITSFMQGRGRPGNGPLDGAGRRSLYTSVRRNFLPPMMLAFDTPQPFNSVGRRNVSNVPAQALIMMNDPFVVEQSKVWARRLLQNKELSSEERIDQIYQSAFSRSPTSRELSDALAFLEEQISEHGLSNEKGFADERVWADLCHVMMNVKEFIFIN